MPEMDRFAFVIHPLSLIDMARKYPFMRYLPKPVLRLILNHYPPKVTSRITGIRSRTGAEVEGMFIGCPLTSEMLVHGDPDAATEKIIACGRVAEREGAKIVGLGAFTSVVGDAGVTIARELDVAVTTGNTYTIATAIEGALRACRALGRDPKQLRAGVVGAGGSIGRGCSRLLAGDVASLTLVDLDAARLSTVAAELDGLVELTTSTDPATALPDLDLVITVTSAVTAVIEADYLKRGAVVCDVARPRDVSKDVARARPDVLVIEGGMVRVPGDVEFNLDFGFPPRTSYACMAETIMLALEGRFEDYSLGRELSLERVAETRAMAQKHGFELAGFRSFERPVTDEAIERVRQLAAG
jgi:predicted amino acid dehydrogenase